MHSATLYNQITTSNIYSLVRFEEHSATPKYLQIINCIKKAVQDGTLQKDYLLPSINDFSYELNLSRSTVQRIYEQLKKAGVIDSFPGKGYFISPNELEIPKVFLLFDNLSGHNKIIYDAFVATLGEHAVIELKIYNNDFGLFKKLLQNRREDYHYYVIVPHLLNGDQRAAEIINELPAGKLILLDKLIADVKGVYGAVYENYERDIYTALKEAIPHLSKYCTLKIILPSYKYFPKEILNGFQFFCQEYGFDFRIVHNLEKEEIRSRELYINLNEDDLMVLLSKIKKDSLQIGRDVGIISYNETPWKEFIFDGITTMSTDFRKMGEVAANMILQKEKAHLEVPFSLTLRRSI
ncbi:MAG TPA: GntR family transcriptional regulator [Niabella sp.]|nr:GntR family transcriptional regulator [Niabella sp.]HOZ97840.1 GntR family transcriptional regulator [Niabella sp.]HQW15678.1 GntR family transcriptional regulator [Niabella sp.]HQX20805.1 GntR family transcriptional regulator [Niabella sp.]HQX41389.1 GntR family transcriptional regulator [Niabella sp.]